MPRTQKRSLKEVVGEITYTVWATMLKELVPDGRTHRLAPMIGGMLTYAVAVAYKEHGTDAEKGSVAHSLLLASEAVDPDDAMDALGDMVKQLFRDAKVTYGRVSSRGDEYSIVEGAIYEFVNWYNMPWES